MDHEWSQRFGDSLDQSVSRVTVDGVGNVYLTGKFEGIVDFGGGPLTPGGLDNVFIAKFDSEGNHLWSNGYGMGFAGATDLKLDAAGNIIITGRFCGQIDFGGGDLPISCTNLAAYDIFVAKFDPDGNHLWSLGFGDEADQSGDGLAVDSDGNILLTGWIDGRVDFGGGLIGTGYNTRGFVAKYDSDGNHIWSKDFGKVSTFNSQACRSIEVDSLDNVMLLGEFGPAIQFGGAELLSNGGSLDIFLAKLDAGGTHLWSQNFGDSDRQYGRCMALDGSDNIVFAGNYHGNVDFGGMPLSSAGGNDIYLVKFNSDGTHVWSQSFGDVAYNQFALGIAVDHFGKTVITGSNDGVVNFGGEPLMTMGESDVFIACFDPTGQHIWSVSAGDSAHQNGNSVAMTESDDVLAAGDFAGTVDFGGGPLSCTGENIFYKDIYLAKFAHVATSIEVSITAFDDGLIQIYPNPFNPSTRIEFGLNDASRVSLAVFDGAGRLVRVLVDENRGAGNFTEVWDGLNDYGRAVTSGVYFIRLTAGNRTITKKAVLLK